MHRVRIRFPTARCRDIVFIPTIRTMDACAAMVRIRSISPMIQMDMIASRMGWDPVEFREKNLIEDGDVLVSTQQLLK